MLYIYHYDDGERSIVCSVLRALCLEALVPRGFILILYAVLMTKIYGVPFEPNSFATPPPNIQESENLPLGYQKKDRISSILIYSL